MAFFARHTGQQRANVFVYFYVLCDIQDDELICEKRPVSLPSTPDLKGSLQTPFLA